jgi:rubrerythrin
MKYIRKDKYTKPETVVDVLKLALVKEKASYDFYDQMLKRFKSPSLQKLLTDLKKEELTHIKKIEKQLKK